MSDRSVPRRLLNLALPVIGLNVLNVMALFVDTAMVGHVPNADAALTGLGYGVQLLFLLMVGMMGLTVGTVALVSRAHGAGLGERVRHILHQSSQLTILLGVGMGILGNLAAPALLELLGAHGDAKAQALLYMRPLLFSLTFNYLTILYGGVLRGVGNTRLAVLAALLMNGVNFVLNYGFILGHYGLPAMGVQGAALGTVIAQIVSVATLVWSIRRGRVPGLDLPLVPAPIDRALARALILIGTPAALDMVVLNAGFLSIVGMLARTDQTAVAAHGVGLRIQALAFVPGMSLAQACAAMVGNALGARDPQEARRVVRSTLALCLAVMSTLALLVWAGDAQLLALFELDVASGVGQASRIWILMLALCMPTAGIYLSFNGAFQGSGNTRIALWINALSTLLVQIPMSLLLGFPLGLGITGIWMGFPIAFVVKALAGFLAYRFTSWDRVGATI